MSAAVSRWFVRCCDCLAVSAVEEPPNTHEWACGICAGPLEALGRVEKDRLITEHVESVCDWNCTSARGPKCGCKCNGKNHGTGRVVIVRRDAGPRPTVTPSTGREQARLNAAEYRQLREAALSLLDPLLASKARGYLPAAEFTRMRQLQAANRKASEARTHAARVKILRAVVGHLPTPASHPVAAVAHETHQAIAAARPLADVPFSLSPTTNTPAANRQDRLF